MAKKILLADDSITIQKVVRITLADGDYELITTDNGDDALAKIKELRPDLIMADVVMPGKDGYQVCQAVKADPQLQHIPVMLLAGSFEGFDEMKGAQIGADGYIIKPFESQTLVSKVEELLARGPVAPAAPVEAPAPAPAAHEEEIPLTSDFEPAYAASAEADLWGDTPAAPEPPPPDEDIFSEPSSPPPPRPAPAWPPVVSEPTLPGRSPVPAKTAPPPAPPPPEPAWTEPEPPAPAMESDWQEGQEPLAEAAPAEAWSEPEPPAPAPVADSDWLGHPEPPVYPAPEWPAGEEPAPPAEAVPAEETIPFAEDAPYAEEAAPAEAEIQLAEATAYQADGYAVEGEAFSEAAPEEMQVLSPAESLMEEAVPYQEMPAEGEVMEAVSEPAAAGEEIPMAEAYAEPEPALAEEAPAEAYAPEALAYAEPEAAYAEPAPAVPAAEYAEAEPAPVAPAADWSRARPVVAQAAEEIATAAGSGLSKEELLTIVRDTVEKVVWDIVPQLAEALIEERIRHWEAQKA